MEQNVKVMQEKAVLVGLNCDLFTKEEAANERTLDELEALLETAGGVCVGKILQNRHEPDPHSFIGEGKAEEVREWVQNTGATLVHRLTGCLSGTLQEQLLICLYLSPMLHLSLQN